MAATPERVRISFDQLLTRGYWMYRRNPVLVVPTMIQTSLQVIYQAMVIIPGLFLVFQLLRSGTLQGLVAAAANQEYYRLHVILASPDFLGPVLLFTVVIGVGLAVIAVVGGGILAAGEFGTYAAIIEGGDGSVSTATILGSMSRLWRGLARTQLAYSLIVFGPLLIALALVFSAAFYLPAALPSQGLAVVGLLFLLLIGVGLGGIATAVFALLGVYTFPAAVVEGHTGLAAYKRSYRIARDNFRPTFTYAVVRIGVFIAIGGVAIASAYVGAPLSSLAQAVVTFLFLPLLHVSKTSMYYAITQGRSVEPELGTPSVTQDFWRAVRNELVPLIRRGLGELATYVFSWRNAIFHVGAVTVFILGIYLGESISQGGLGDVLKQAGIGQGTGGGLVGLSPFRWESISSSTIGR